MQTGIRRDVPIPYYYQLIQVLQEAIGEGTWAPDVPLPSEHDLCAAYNVSRTVVRQALGELVARGLLYRVKGKGTFVAPRKVEEHFVQRAHGFHDDMTSRGHTVATTVLAQEVVSPPPHVRQRLKLGSDKRTVKIDRLRSVDGALLLYVETYIPHHLCPGLEDRDLSLRSLYDTLRREWGLSVTAGTRTVEAVAARPPIAPLLGIGTGDPLLRIESLGCTGDGTPVEYYEAWHRGDRTKIEIEIAPGGPDEGPSRPLVLG